MRTNSLLGLLLLLSLLTTIQAQTIRVAFHKLSTENGLSQGSNAFIYQDKKGFVWISSIDGLNRFDGRSVKTYRKDKRNQLLDNIITSRCFEDSKGDLWFTTYEGLHHFDRQTEQFTPTQLVTKYLDTIRQDYYAFHLDTSQHLWVRTGLGPEGRLQRFNTRTGDVTQVGQLDGGRIFVFDQVKGNKVELVACSYIGRSGIGISQVQDTIQTNYYFTKSDSLPALTSYAAHRDEAGMLWLAMQDGLIAFSQQSGKAKYFHTYNGKNIGDALAVRPLDGDQLIVATRNEGVLIFSIKEAKFIQRLPHESKPTNDLSLPLVNNIYVDDADNLWLSSPRRGLKFGSLLKNKFAALPELEGIAVRSVFQSSNGVVWTNGPAGWVYQFTSNGQLISKLPLDPKSSNSKKKQVSSFFEDQNASVWIVSGSSLLRYDQATQKFTPQTQLPASYLSHLALQDDTYLFATYAGIYRMTQSRGNIDFSPFLAIGELQERLATAMFLDNKNKLRLALDAKEFATLVPTLAGNYLEESTLDGVGYVYAYRKKREVTWLTTSNGIIVQSDSTNEVRVLNIEDDGLVNEAFYCNIEDQTGVSWLASNRGILSYDPRRKSYHRFTLTDGIQDLEYNSNACLMTTDGWIWMGGSSGANVFRPESIASELQQPKISFSQVMINDELDPNLPPSEVLTELKLPYANNTISIMALSMEYSDPLNNRFRYRLKPNENAWVEAGRNGFIRYPNLTPGQHVLQVLAANSDGVWSLNPRELSIYIHSPWWRTWWFILLCIFITALITYAIFNYRLQQALKVERIRVRISSDLHDDVGSILTGLAMQAEVVELTARIEDKARLNKISTLSRSALARMRDTVWAIDARKDKLQDLIFRIQEHAQEVLSPRGMDFRIEIDPQLDLQREMTSDIRQNLYFIAKEALTNTAKHSNGNEAFIHLRKNGRGLKLSLSDNGKFNKPQNPASGLGLSNLELRTKQINATYTINTENGYCIEINLPGF